VDLKVTLAWMVCLEALDYQVILESHSQERRVSQEILDKEDFQVSLDLRVIEVCLELLDCLDSQDAREIQVPLVPLPTRLALQIRVTLDCLDWMGCLELQAGKEHPEREAALVPLVLEVLLAHPVRMDLKDSLAHKVFQGYLDLMDNLEERDSEEMMDFLVLMEKGVTLLHMD